MPLEPNPYEATTESGVARRGILWRLTNRLAIIGMVVGFSLPILNVILVFTHMWSRPPAPPGTAYSATPGVAATFAAVIVCPVLAALGGAYGGLIGEVINLARSTLTSTRPRNIDA